MQTLLDLASSPPSCGSSTCDSSRATVTSLLRSTVSLDFRRHSNLCSPRRGPSSIVASPRDRLKNQSFYAPATFPLYIVVFSLAPTSTPCHIHGHHFDLPCSFVPRGSPGT